MPFPADDEELVARAGEPCRSAGTSCSSAPGATSTCPGSTRTSPTGCARSQLATQAGRGAPARLAVDSCAGEFEAHTPYYYVTHEGEDEGPEPSGRAVIVLGGGPNRIGQAIEFDYCCVHAAQALRKLGYEAVLVNSNPETVSTDYDTSDRLYLEPLVERNVLDVCALEQPRRRRGLLRGTDPFTSGARAGGRRGAAARRPARRDRPRRGSRPLREARRRPRARSGASPRTPRRRASSPTGSGYPVLVRPHYVIGGRGMHVAHAAEELRVEGPVPRRPLPRGRARARRRRPLRRRGRLGRGRARAHRADRRPLGRLGLRPPGALRLRGARARDPRGREHGSPPGSARAA